MCVLRTDVPGLGNIQLTRERSTVVIGRSRSVDYRIDHPQVWRSIRPPLTPRNSPVSPTTPALPARGCTLLTISAGLGLQYRLEESPGQRVLVTDCRPMAPSSTARRSRAGRPGSPHRRRDDHPGGQHRRRTTVRARRDPVLPRRDAPGALSARAQRSGQHAAQAARAGGRRLGARPRGGGGSAKRKRVPPGAGSSAASAEASQPRERDPHSGSPPAAARATRAKAGRRRPLPPPTASPPAPYSVPRPRRRTRHSHLKAAGAEDEAGRRRRRRRRRRGGGRAKDRQLEDGEVEDGEVEDGLARRGARDRAATMVLADRVRVRVRLAHDGARR